MNITLEKLNSIFNDALGTEIELTNDLKREDVLEWDSFNHLNLIIELESQLNIAFTPHEIENINSIKSLNSILINK